MEDNTTETGKCMQDPLPDDNPNESEVKVDNFTPPPVLLPDNLTLTSPPELPDNQNDSEGKEDILTPSLLKDSQNPVANAQLHLENSQKQSSEETVQLLTTCPDDDQHQKEIQPDDTIEEENPSSQNVKLHSEMPDVDDDKGKQNTNEDLTLQLEDSDAKNKKAVELQREDPSSSAKEKKDPNELVQLSTDAQDVAETAVFEVAAGVSANGVQGDDKAAANNIAFIKQGESVLSHERNSSQTMAKTDGTGDEPEDGVSKMELCSEKEIASNPDVDKVTEIDLKVNVEEIKKADLKPEVDVLKEQKTNELDGQHIGDMKTPNKSFLLESYVEGEESGTEEEQVAFMKELGTFYKERSLDFKPPKFYGEGLNLLKLWRSVIRLGGYEQVTSCKLWRQVGESFKPPKTCTTVSWTFRCFYEKALLEYEKHKISSGELPLIDSSSIEPGSVGNQAGGSQGSGSGRARRDAAARAMQGWHSQRLLGNGEVGDPIIKDKISSSAPPRREKPLKSIGLLKRRAPSPVERDVKVARLKVAKPQLDTTVVDVGHPADWVKINVRKTKDCFEVYALVPGLLREEVRVQSDPAGRLVISGEPEQLDNPWGVTPFKKVVSLPSRIDPHQTSAVVTLHGQLFVRVPFEQSDS